MSVFDNKDGFRPRDYSSSTRIKYQTEADHWIKSIKSAEIANRTTSLGESFSFVGIVLSLIASIVVLIVVCIVDFIKFLKTL